MKRKLFVSIVVLVILSITTVCVLWAKGIIFSDKENPNINNNLVIITEEERYVEKEDNGFVKDKESGKIVYNPNVDYTDRNSYPEISVITREENDFSPYDWDSYDDGFILEYMKYFIWAYPEHSFDVFSDKEIASVVALASQLYIPRSIEEVQAVAKLYFNIDNYELPTGTYKLENYGDFTVTKIDKYYVSSEIQNEKELLNSRYLIDTEIVDNRIIVYYDYAKSFMFTDTCYLPHDFPGDGIKREERCIIGYYQFHFTYEDNKIHLDKIIYEINDKYDE